MMMGLNLETATTMNVSRKLPKPHPTNNKGRGVKTMSKSEPDELKAEDKES